MGLYLRPSTLDVALDALHARALTIVAGGTDFYPARVGKPLTDDVLDIGAIAGLRGIDERVGDFRIGATTTWTDLAEADLPPLFDGLRLAAREIGGVQIQNAGTICGNICNASPAADGVPALLALDAAVELCSARGVEIVGLGDFILGNRRTRRSPDQLVTAVIVPKPAGSAASHFTKLGARRYLVISIVMAAATIEVDASGRIARARVAVGACSPVARRLPALEATLQGVVPDRSLGRFAAATHLGGLEPIDDVRGSASYRTDAALTVVRRLLDELGARL
ncbi:MAG: FAD binding domain-containing protein [Burkholderiales bacterium]|nr:FAD binding domain-containing protein [Burkholderiales bacterium]